MHKRITIIIEGVEYVIAYPPENISSWYVLQADSVGLGVLHSLFYTELLKASAHKLTIENHIEWSIEEK